MNAETFYHQISNQYYTMKKLGPIIDDVLRQKNCKNLKRSGGVTSKKFKF